MSNFFVCSIYVFLPYTICTSIANCVEAKKADRTKVGEQEKLLNKRGYLYTANHLQILVDK